MIAGEDHILKFVKAAQQIKERVRPNVTNIQVRLGPRKIGMAERGQLALQVSKPPLSVGTFFLRRRPFSLLDLKLLPSKIPFELRLVQAVTKLFEPATDLMLHA